MNPILIYNLFFYLSPYVAMILYDFSTRTSNRSKTTISIVLSIVLGSTFIYSLVQFFILGYTKNGEFVTLFGVIPPYLVLFYTSSVILCIIILYLDGHPYYHSLFFGFLIPYISSFYWEIPENIFWQLKRGYHPTIIFILLGVFPYIWLDKKLGWERSRTNILLILLGWAVTLYGVMTMESNIYTTPAGGLYFLFSRVVGLSILIKIFVLDVSVKDN